MAVEVGPASGASVILQSGVELCRCKFFPGSAGVEPWASSEGHFHKSLGPEIVSWARRPQW